MQKREEGNQVIIHLLYHILVFVVEILFFVLIVFGVTRCCQASYQFGYEVFGSVSPDEEPGEDKAFEVQESDTMYQVAERLEDNQLIVNKYSFYIRSRLLDKNQNGLRPGSYTLNTSMDYEEIINELTMSE